MSSYFDQVGAQLNELTRARQPRGRRALRSARQVFQARPLSISLALAATVAACVLTVVLVSSTAQNGRHSIPAARAHTGRSAGSVTFKLVGDIVGFRHARWTVEIYRATTLGNPTVKRISISARGIATLPPHAAYGFWLISAHAAGDTFLGFLATNPADGRFRAIGVLPKDQTFQALELTSQTGSQPTTPGPVILRGLLPRGA